MVSKPVLRVPFFFIPLSYSLQGMGETGRFGLRPTNFQTIMEDNVMAASKTQPHAFLHFN